MNNLGDESTFEIAMLNTSADTLQAQLICGPTGLFDIEVPGIDMNPNQTENITLTFDERIAETVFTKSLTIEVDDLSATRYTVPVTKSVSAGPPGVRMPVIDEDCEAFDR